MRGIPAATPATETKRQAPKTTALPMPTTDPTQHHIGSVHPQDVHSRCRGPAAGHDDTLARSRGTGIHERPEKERSSKGRCPPCPRGLGYAYQLMGDSFGVQCLAVRVSIQSQCSSRRISVLSRGTRNGSRGTSWLERGSKSQVDEALHRLGVEVEVREHWGSAGNSSCAKVIAVPTFPEAAGRRRASLTKSTGESRLIETGATGRVGASTLAGSLIPTAFAEAKACPNGEQSISVSWHSRSGDHYDANYTPSSHGKRIQKPSRRPSSRSSRSKTSSTMFERPFAEGCRPSWKSLFRMSASIRRRLRSAHRVYARMVRQLLDHLDDLETGSPAWERCQIVRTICRIVSTSSRGRR